MVRETCEAPEPLRTGTSIGRWFLRAARSSYLLLVVMPLLLVVMPLRQVASFCF